MPEKKSTNYKTSKYTALLDWVFCESSVENYNHEQINCVYLFNQYMRLKKEETNN